MVFSSVPFLFYFLPVFMAVYVVAGPFRSWVIEFGSFLFYGWGDPIHTPLLAFVIVLNWMFGLLIGRGAAGSRRWLALGCGINVLVLVCYKYTGFLVGQVNLIAGAVGGRRLTFAAAALPLGISFFTFQGISYLIDISRRVVAPQRSLLKFAMYKAMFPQLIAGPIVRYSQIAGEVDDRRLRLDAIASGVQFFIVGLAQKVLVANTVAVPADKIFALPPAELTAATAWLGAVCYMIQIYFDFGGYSNMAIGLGRMMGFTLPPNFDNPYLSGSMTEFWRRWHISLSTWFRDYLYIPLGGNRRGSWRTYRNLLITFALCGFWHGAAWTFVVWGLYHGVFLIIERIWSARFKITVAWPLRHAYALLAVLIGWVIFRSESLGDAAAMLTAMAGFGDASPIAWPAARFASPAVLTALSVAGLAVVTPKLRDATDIQRIMRRLPAPAWDAMSLVSALALFLLSAVAVGSGSYNPFIYFRF